MKKFDATKYTRQMFHQPNIVPFFNILIIILIIMHLTVFFQPSRYIDIPTAENDEYAPVNVFPEIVIMRNGLVVLDGRPIEDLEKLPLLIEYEREVHRSPGNKVLFMIDKDCPFGKMQEVLTLVKKMNVETIGLITLEDATLEHLWKTPIK